MIETQPSITRDQLPDLIRSSERFWMRSPDVILGLLQEEDEDFVYWKWNEKTMQGRMTPALKDKKCFKGVKKNKRPSFDAGAVLSYKPESRIVWKCKYKGNVCCKKMYKAGSFDHRARSSELLSRAAHPEFTKLLEIDREARSMAWEWIDGRSPVSKKDFNMALQVLTRLHRIDTAGANVLQLTDGHVFGHIKTRINTLMAWICVLDDDVRTRISPIADVWDRIVEQFLNLKPSEDLSILHGDYRTRNILIDAAERLRIIDADHAAVGHREWDYAALAADTLDEFDSPWQEAFEEALASENLDRDRLLAYSNVWRVLIGIKAIEEKDV